MHLLFTTGTVPKRIRFQVAAPISRVFFSTGSAPVVSHFRVGVPRRSLRFTTESKRVEVRFRVGVPLPYSLQCTLTQDSRCLLVTLAPSLPEQEYTVKARRWGEATSLTACKVNAPGARQYRFDVGEDAVWEVELHSPYGVAASAVVLVNHQSLKALSRMAKRVVACSQEFEERCYYNAQVILLYQDSRFTACMEMLTLLRDVACNSI